MNMKLYLIKEERDYSNSGGLFSSDQFQDIEVFDEDKNFKGWIEVVQSYTHHNQWGSHQLSGRTHRNTLHQDIIKYIEDKYRKMDVDLVNELFKPLEYTKEDEYEEVNI